MFEDVEHPTESKHKACSGTKSPKIEKNGDVKKIAKQYVFNLKRSGTDMDTESGFGTDNYFSDLLSMKNIN